VDDETLFCLNFYWNCPTCLNVKGYGQSPNSATNHRIYELRLPLNNPPWWGWSPGDTVPFGLYVYDSDGGCDLWPTHPTLVDPCGCPETLGELTLAQSPAPPPSPVPNVPTTSLWGTLAMTVALAGLLAWKLRRGTASSST